MGTCHGGQLSNHPPKPEPGSHVVPRPEDPLLLTDDAPREVRVLHEAILDLLEEGPPIIIALNLHASNSEPDIRPFFYPISAPNIWGTRSGSITLGQTAPVHR